MQQINLRSPETQARYDAHKQQFNTTKECFMCKYNAPTLKDCWKIVPNEFPYDTIAMQHDLLVYTYHEEEPAYGDVASLHGIKEFLYIIGGYDAIIENAPVNRTVPQHYHLHLIKYKTV